MGKEDRESLLSGLKDEGINDRIIINGGRSSKRSWLEVYSFSPKSFGCPMMLGN